MKKILTIIITFFTVPFVALAADYDIDHFYIDATIKTNGDMDVSELIVLNGIFNGYERDILYRSAYEDYNASQITNLRVYGNLVDHVTINSFNDNYEEFNEVEYANNGEKNKYIVSSLNNGIRIRMYYNTNNKSTAFLLKYTLKNVGIMHEDVVEFYWNFFGMDFEDNINDIKIKINYPSKLSKEDFNWWFHGDLSGNSEIYEENDGVTHVLATLNFLKKNTPIDFRTLIPKGVFSDIDFMKFDNEYVKEDIIKKEDEIVRKDNELRRKNKIVFKTFQGMCIAFYVILIITWVYVYKKYDKERKPKFIHKYNREFIDDYNVEVIDYLFNNDITPNALSASIMNLIYKKNISIDKTNYDKEGYRFILNNRDNLNDTENYLVDFLFNTVGKNSENYPDQLTFTTKDLKSYAKSTKTCNSFMSSYTNWKNKVIEDGKKEGFYDNLNERYKYGIFILMLAFLIYFVGVAICHVSFLLIHTIIFASIAFIIYIGCIKRKSEKGIEDYAKWKAFKNFLNDFASFETKELPEVVLWERYLVYATIFGLAKKLEKEMNVRIKEIMIDDTYYGDTYFFVNNMNLTSDINASISMAYREAQETITRESLSSSDGTFGGSGGGFSSGGGFGGGGGGGRGF